MPAFFAGLDRFIIRIHALDISAAQKGDRKATEMAMQCAGDFAHRLYFAGYVHASRRFDFL